MQQDEGTLPEGRMWRLGSKEVDEAMDEELRLGQGLIPHNILKILSKVYLQLRVLLQLALWWLCIVFGRRARR